MREGWREVRLSELCDIQLGKTPARANSSYWDESKSTSNIWVSIADLLKTEGNKVSESKEFISDSGAKQCKIVKKGTLLVSFKLTLGRVAFAGRDLYTNEAIAALSILDEKIVSREYLFYFFHFFDWVKAARDDVKLKGMTLNKAKLKEIRIVVPPLPEQKRIVAILDEAFAGIATAVANTEKNLASARELFESYLNAVFSQEGRSWEQLTLRGVCIDYGRGKSKHRPRNDPRLYGGAYPFIQTGDVRNADHLIKVYSKTYNDSGLKQSKLWPKGTICITIAANIAETGLLDFDACFPDSIIGLVVNEERASSTYVEFLLQSVKSVLKAKGKGSAQDNINLGTLENERFPFPDRRTQNRVVETVQELRVFIRSLESIYQQKLQALAELKQSLLQKAFSGELTTAPQDEIETALA